MAPKTPPRAAASPAPSRRTPRSGAGTSPARLGVNDSWGEKSASKWVPEKSSGEEERKKKEQYKKEKDAQDKALAKAGKKTNLTKQYKAAVAKHPYVVAVGQSLILQLLAFVTGKLIKGEDPLAVDYTFIAFGALPPLILIPWFKIMNPKKFAASPKMNGFAKAFCGQLVTSPLLTALFISICMAKSSDYTVVLKMLKKDFLSMLKTSFPFWLASDTLSFTVMPAAFQPLWAAFASFVYSIILALSS